VDLAGSDLEFGRRRSSAAVRASAYRRRRGPKFSRCLRATDATARPESNIYGVRMGSAGPRAHQCFEDKSRISY
jgi:hypothetical protein